MAAIKRLLHLHVYDLMCRCIAASSNDLSLLITREQKFAKAILNNLWTTAALCCVAEDMRLHSSSVVPRTVVAETGRRSLQHCRGAGRSASAPPPGDAKNPRYHLPLGRKPWVLRTEGCTWCCCQVYYFEFQFYVIYLYTRESPLADVEFNIAMPFSIIRASFWSDQYNYSSELTVSIYSTI